MWIGFKEKYSSWSCDGIGLAESRFRWIDDNRRLGYTKFWRPNYPKSNPDYECGYMWVIDGDWGDTKCSRDDVHLFVCKTRAAH
jgi:hypothetical protein